MTIQSIESLRGGLVASCQAPAGSPLREPYIMGKIAQATVMSGAVGIRANGPADIAAIKALTAVPVIGLFKVRGPRRYLITPDLPKAEALVAAGADIVAVDATDEAREAGIDLVALLKAELEVPIMADISTVAEAVRAWNCGADLVGTTLSGYTPQTLSSDEEEPDLALVEALAARGMTVIAEGRYRTPHHVGQAFEAGAHAVVVGGAITDPFTTTGLFVRNTPRGAASTAI